MKSSINVFIVENEPIILNAILSALESMGKLEYNLNVETKIAKDYDEALTIINRRVNLIAFDLVMLNIDIPLSSNEKPVFAEELGLKIQTLFSETKLITFGSHCDNYRINNIFKKLKPEGFFIKKDVDCKELEKAIHLVLSDEVYYSRIIMRLIRRRIVDDIVLDNADKQILYFLSKGVKTKDLSKYVYLSDGGIQRRKRRLKEVFEIDDRNDIRLLKLAEEKGFI